VLHVIATTETSGKDSADPTNWIAHRPEFAGYDFTGPLRPAKLTPRRTIPPHIKKPDYADRADGEPISEKDARLAIPIYTPEQITKIRKACEISAQVLAETGKMAKPGVTCDEIDRFVHERTIELGAYPSPLNYRGFPKSVCTSLNEVVCHGIPDMTELKDGDILNVDVSCYYDGVHGDVNETWLIGNVADEHKKLVETSFQCLNEAIAICKPGQLIREVGNVITKCATKNGCSVIRTYCGHGIGEHFHCSPNVPHYANSKAVGVMKPGMIFTIEPMINAGKYNDKLWPDDWTSVTVDGKRSAQFEHTLLITDTGVEIITKRPFGTYVDRY